jgi:pimeloyl-ACP methyl ester carboxylesterase
MTPTESRHVRRGVGDPLVVIPGLSAHGGLPPVVERWMSRRQIRGFARHYDVWRIDRPRGLGSGTSVADLAADYALTLRGLFGAPVPVVGVSTGGSIALQLAVDNPLLVTRLVLVSSACRLSESGRRAQSETARLVRAGRRRRAAAVFLSQTANGPVSRGLLRAVGFVAPGLVVGRRDADLLVTIDAEDSFDLEDRLAALPVPTLVIGGERDAFYSPDLFERTVAAIPDARLRLYPRAGHQAIAGNPRLVREVLRFLATA